MQLFEYTQSRRQLRQRSNVPAVYFEYIYQRIQGRVVYPSTLSLNLHGTAPLRPDVVIGRRPRLPTDTEQGRIPFSEMSKRFFTEDSNTIIGTEAPASTFSYSVQRLLDRKRLSGEPCLLPDKRLHRLSCGTLGAFVLEFSPNGRYLAAACGEYLMYPIKVFDVDSGSLEITLNGHHDLIHDLSWSKQSDEIVSASADHTVRVWTLSNTSSRLSIQHPSFVYAARFCAIKESLPNQSLIISAGYDHIVRIWEAETGSLLSELSGHSSPINTIAVDPDGKTFWTGDSSGLIRVWDRDTTSPIRRFCSTSRISHDEIKGKCITCIRKNSTTNAILVMCRDSTIYSFGGFRHDLRQKLTGAVCEKTALQFCISPDGQMALSASEDGSVYAWRIATGKVLAEINAGYASPTYSVAWHPTQHLIAMCSFGGDYPICLYDRSREATRKSIMSQADEDDATYKDLDLPGSPM